jgi:predicted transcriptional regulator
VRQLRRQSRTEEVPMFTTEEQGNRPIENDNKLATNREQSDNKPTTKLATNRQQTGNRSTEASGIKIETANKVTTEPTTLSATKWQQTDSKVATNPVFSSLVGLQRNIILFIYSSCKLARSKSTDALTLEHIAQTLQTSSGSVKTTLQRLEKKNYIERISFKNGRGGWSKYELSEILFRELLQLETENKVTTNWQQTENKVVAKVATEPATTLLSSSSYINTTTNYKAGALAKIELTESLTLIGFNQGHIEQLLRDSSLGSEEIQNSLNAFAFDLGFEDVKRKVRSPIGLIMKLLKNGQAYISEKGYESEEDRLYRELIERADKKNEEKKNLKSKLVEIKFEEWLENISDNDKKILAEPVGEFMGIIHRQELKEYFKKEVYSANNI